MWHIILALIHAKQAQHFFLTLAKQLVLFPTCPEWLVTTGYNICLSVTFSLIIIHDSFRTVRNYGILQYIGCLYTLKEPIVYHRYKIVLLENVHFCLFRVPPKPFLSGKNVPLLYIKSLTCTRLFAIPILTPTEQIQGEAQCRTQTWALQLSS